MDLGNFSVSLAVREISISRDFYEKLGFKIFAGHADQGWLIMKNPNCVVGLFQGMLEKNTMTFNPGWDDEGQPVNPYTDIREIQKRLKAAGIEFESEADESGTGPGRAWIKDPDGNPILLDQHV